MKKNSGIAIVIALVVLGGLGYLIATKQNTETAPTGTEPLANTPYNSKADCEASTKRPCIFLSCDPYQDLSVTPPQNDFCPQPAGWYPVTSSYLKPNIDNWKTYRNEKYGFEVKMPSRWSPDDTEEVKDVYYRGVNIFLRLPSENSGLQPVCHFSVYQSSQWDRLQREAETSKPIFLASKSDVTYGWGCGHDDYGYRGFEEYNRAIDNQQLKNLSIGPFEEFKKSILPTFKFIE